MGNLIVARDSITVLTDMEMLSYDNVKVERGAVLVAVPDLSDEDERIEIAQRMWALVHPEEREES